MNRQVTAALALMLVTTVAASRPVRGQGAGEGIKVHGRWTIEVRNPDGTLASRHEFENNLIVFSGGGSGVLAGLLGRLFTGLGPWQIELLGTQNGGFGPGPCPQSGGLGDCVIVERAGAGEPAVGELKVTAPLDPNLPASLRFPAGTVELSGLARAQAAAPIGFVRTSVTVCREATCSGNDKRSFTHHQLAAPINVTANQLIQVTVVFSFS